jgi:SAM-dependent methyltransferase
MKCKKLPHSCGSMIRLRKPRIFTPLFLKIQRLKALLGMERPGLDPRERSCLLHSSSKEFDIVYTSGGVLCWLPDLNRWAEIVVNYLKPEVTVYILEGHPIVRVFKPRTDGSGKPVEWRYFDKGPIEVEEQRSNGNPSPHPSHKAYYWSHSLGEIITALCFAGLRIEFLHEFPETIEERSYEEVEPDRYELRVHRKVVIPDQFSIRATH